jgi:hypothetical protein
LHSSVFYPATLGTISLGPANGGVRTRVKNGMSSNSKTGLAIVYGLVFSSVRYCLPLWGSIRLTEKDTATKLSKSVQIEINNALRCALGLSRKDHVTVIDLHEKTKSLTFNQLVIQATNRLTANIFSGDCKGLENFYEQKEQPTRTTRFT